MWRCEVRRGRAGKALDFGEPGVLDGDTAKARSPRAAAQATTGWPDRHRRSFLAAELLADSGSEPGATRARSSSIWPLEQPRYDHRAFSGWAGQSPSPITRKATHVQIERLLWTLTRRCSFTRNRRIGIARFVAQRSLLCCGDACRWLLGPPNKALATASPFRDGQPFS